MTVNGIDVSHWNEHITPGLFDFIFHKATQGTYMQDPLYPERSKEIRSTGKLFWPYMFADVRQSATSQVDYFRNYADVQPGDVIGIDFENEGTWGGLTNPAIAASISTIVHYMVDAFPHHRVALYCNRSTYYSIVLPYSVPLGDGLWIASPGVDPLMPWLFWQYGNGSVDYDRANFTDLAALTKWATGQVTTDSRRQQQLLLNG